MLADRRGLDICVVDFKADLIQPDAAAANEAGSLLEQTIHACEKLGIRRLNGFTGFLAGKEPTAFAKNGSALATDGHYNRCAERLRKAATVAEQAGVALSLEVHMNTIHDTVASTLRLLELVGSPNVTATPDPGNLFATRPGERAPEPWAPLRGRIGHVHLKNCVQRGSEFDYSVPLSGGHIDIYRHLRQLLGLGYTGAFCLEYVGSGDPHVPAVADIEYLKRCLSWMLDGQAEA